MYMCIHKYIPVVVTHTHTHTQMILSQEEVDIKSKLWFAENGDFLKEQECKHSLFLALSHTHTALYDNDSY